MRRDPALQDLSRDHHAILILAQHLRKAADGPEAHEAALRHLRGHIPPLLLHFQEEESLVFPNLAPQASAHYVSDHEALRKDLARLALEGTLPAERLVSIGEEIRDHIRREEAAFDGLQRVLGPRQVAALGDHLLQFRRRHRPQAIGAGTCDFPPLSPA